MVDLLERIDVMLLKETTSYHTRDYLASDFQQQLSLVGDSEVNAPSVALSSSASLDSLSTSSSTINEVWREKICEWSYQVIDHFDFSREVVSVSIHYLDRYLATRQVNKKTFQLAAMTTLFLAIKLYEPGRLSMTSMIELSRGYFTVEQMSSMEMSILRALKWQVHPPTAYCFAKHLLFLLPYHSVTMDVRHDVLELSRFLAELSVIDYFFVGYRPSVVAVASLFNALEDIPAVSDAARVEFLSEIRKISNLDSSSEDVVACRNRIRLLYAQGGYSRPADNVVETQTRTETVSPVCVSFGCNPYEQHESVAVVRGEESKNVDNYVVNSLQAGSEAKTS